MSDRRQEDPIAVNFYGEREPCSAMQDEEWAWQKQPDNLSGL